MTERIFGGKGSYEKYSLVEKQDLGMKVKEFKQNLIFGKVSNPPQLLQTPQLFGTLEYAMPVP